MSRMAHVNIFLVFGNYNPSRAHMVNCYVEILSTQKNVLIDGSKGQHDWPLQQQ